MYKEIIWKQLGLKSFFTTEKWLEKNASCVKNIIILNICVEILEIFTLKFT